MQDHNYYCETMEEMILGLARKIYPEVKFIGNHACQDLDPNTAVIAIFLEDCDKEKILFRINIVPGKPFKFRLHVYKLADDVVSEVASRLSSYFNSLDIGSVTC